MKPLPLLRRSAFHPHRFLERNNLSPGNMDPEDFAGSADADGIFSGF
jgi:hypothetical protein